MARINRKTNEKYVVLTRLVDCRRARAGVVAATFQIRSLIIRHPSREDEEESHEFRADSQSGLGGSTAIGGTLSRNCGLGMTECLREA